MNCPSCGAALPEGFRFCGQCGHKLDAAPEPPSAALSPEPPPLSGERREVTVLFTDVAGFTAMSEELDPEELQVVMNECFAGLGQAVREEQGHIDKYIGDALMALFGAPIAHEDDPARACRAALAMQRFFEGFADAWEERSGTRLAIRIGIHTGLVLAGDVGSEARMDYSVMGDTVNTASRLESAAPRGGVLVSRRVVARTGGRFEFGPPLQLSLRGKSGQVEAHELRRETRRIDPRGRNDLSVDLCGRDREVEELLRRWRRALENPQDRWIELRGDLGLGKTRIVEEAAHHLTGVTLLPVVATPDACRRPFGLARLLIFRVLWELLGERERPETRESLARAIEPLGTTDLESYVDGLWFLVAPSRLRVPPPDPNPQAMRRTLEAGLRALVVALARREPGLALLLDSWEFADAASAEVFESLVRRPEGAPLPLIVVSRGEGRPPLRPDEVLEIPRLSPEASSRLLERLVRGATLPPDLREDLLSRAAGVPYYIEELVRSLIDQGILRPSEDGTPWWCDPRATPATLPSSVRAAMLARLDRQPRPERNLLGQASVQGTQFDLDVLATLRRLPHRQGPPVFSLVEALEARRLVEAVPGTPSDRRAFQHPMLREACYETMLLRERRELHGETANALCELAGGSMGVSPEVLAHHYERAERIVEAAEAHVRAGDRAADFYLNDQAVDHYRRTLDVAEEREDAVRCRALAHGGLARVELRTGDHAAADRDARAMLRLAGGDADQAEANRLLAVIHFYVGRVRKAEHHFETALQTARRSRDGGTVLPSVLYHLSDFLHRTGRRSETEERLREARAVTSEPEWGVRLDMLEGRIAHQSGRLEEATELYRRAYATAERLGTLSERARAANSLGNVARDVGDYETARVHYERARTIWERMGDREAIAGASTNLGNLAMSAGDLGTARRHHGRSLEVYQRIGNVHGVALARVNLAVLALENGEGREAQSLARASLETARAVGNAWMGALIENVLGDAHLVCDEQETAENTFRGVLERHGEEDHPLAAAGALRGLGRVASRRRAWTEARSHLERALATFLSLQRAQELARTRLDYAEVLHGLGETGRAWEEADAARTELQAIRAARDVERAERLLATIG